MAKSKQETMEDLFREGHKNIYHAEKMILKALPEMARGAQSDDVRAAFERHKKETETQVDRLEKIFAVSGKRAQGTTCPAIGGIIENGAEIIDEHKDTAAFDAGLAGAAPSSMMKSAATARSSAGRGHRARRTRSRTRRRAGESSSTSR